MVSPAGWTTLQSYDGAGNQTQVIDSLGGTVLSTYDGNNYLTRRTYSGQTLEMRYDFVNNKEGWNTTLTRYADLAGSNLVAKTVYDYNGAGTVTHIMTTDVSSVTIDEFTYNLDSYDNVTQLIETQHGATTTVTYGYDSAGQLTNDDGTTLTYDGSGNRTGGSYGVTTGNEMSADASWTYQYDKEGNLTEKDTTAGGSSEKWTYAWSADNKLAEVKHYDSAGSLALTVDYRYDAFGELIQKDDGTYVTKYGVDGWNPNMSSPIGNENFDVLADLNGSNSLATRYLRGDKVDELKARIDAIDSALETSWILTDHLGSARDVIDNSGMVLDSLKYDSFGNIDDGTELDAAYRGRYTWTGREFDVETQLQFNRARYYDSTTGRWISQDPLGFDAGDSNLYRYVNNRATGATDPNGLQDQPSGTAPEIKKITNVRLSFYPQEGGTGSYSDPLKGVLKFSYKAGGQDRAYNIGFDYLSASQDYFKSLKEDGPSLQRTGKYVAALWSQDFFVEYQANMTGPVLKSLGLQAQLTENGRALTPPQMLSGKYVTNQATYAITSADKDATKYLLIQTWMSAGTNNKMGIDVFLGMKQLGLPFDVTAGSWNNESNFLSGTYSIPYGTASSGIEFHSNKTTPRAIVFGTPFVVAG